MMVFLTNPDHPPMGLSCNPIVFSAKVKGDPFDPLSVFGFESHKAPPGVQVILNLFAEPLISGINTPKCDPTEYADIVSAH